MLLNTYQCSIGEWAEVTMGVPQGSILGLLLLRLFVNDLADEECSINHFAEDTAIYFADSNSTVLKDGVDKDLGRVVDWSHCNELRMVAERRWFLAGVGSKTRPGLSG